MKAVMGLIVAVLSLVVPATVLSLTTDLIAGQHTDVGDVRVWDDGGILYVRYTTDTGWKLKETHVHVADSLGGIPQKNGNPIPGQFKYKMEHDPAVAEYTYEITLPSSWEAGTTLCIAAHAVVCEEEQQIISSQGGVLYTTTLLAGQTIDSGDVEVALDGENLVITFTTKDGWEMLETHLYLGESAPTSSAPGRFPFKHENLGGVTIDIYTIPLESLGLACDDTLYIAAHAVVRKLIEDGVYQTETAWGEGTRINAKGNWAMYFVTAVECDGQQIVITICEDTETAWGKGLPFPGKNWAMYFTYILGSSSSPAPGRHSSLTSLWGKIKAK